MTAILTHQIKRLPRLLIDICFYPLPIGFYVELLGDMVAGLSGSRQSRGTSSGHLGIDVDHRLLVNPANAPQGAHINVS